MTRDVRVRPFRASDVRALRDSFAAGSIARFTRFAFPRSLAAVYGEFHQTRMRKHLQRFAILINGRFAGVCTLRAPLFAGRELTIGIFDPRDHCGFGEGIGFHARHTLAAGLANTDELLTLLQFDLFGWPPLFAFGLLLVPFLTARAGVWDYLAAGGVLAFVAAYVGYFYHGIALGPRYYFEAMPWLLLLGGRGVQELARLGGSRVAVGLVLGALTLNTLLFYTPAELQRRLDLGGLPGGIRVSLGFVQS